MDIIVKLALPDHIYRFYRNSAQYICGSSAETVMADALAAYAGLLSPEIARQHPEEKEPGEKSDPSRSR